LVSTHYMDEAERCQRIIYLSSGRIVVQGTADQVVRDAGVITFETSGDGIDGIARLLRQAPGVDGAAVFGRILRVAGSDRTALRQAIASADRGNAHVWREVEPRLEDVFIHLLVRGEPS